MEILRKSQLWPFIELVGRLIKALERAGVDKIYVFAILLVVAIVLDSLLITLLVSIRYLLFLGLLGLPFNAALRCTTGASTSLDKNIAQSLDKVYEIPRILDDSHDRPDGESEEDIRETVLAKGSTKQTLEAPG